MVSSQFVNDDWWQLYTVLIVIDFMNIKEKKLANISTSATGGGMRDGGSRDNGDAKHD